MIWARVKIDKQEIMFFLKRSLVDLLKHFRPHLACAFFRNLLQLILILVAEHYERSGIVSNAF